MLRFTTSRKKKTGILRGSTIILYKTVATTVGTMFRMAPKKSRNSCVCRQDTMQSIVLKFSVRHIQFMLVVLGNFHCNSLPWTLLRNFPYKSSNEQVCLRSPACCLAEQSKDDTSMQDHSSKSFIEAGRISLHTRTSDNTRKKNYYSCSLLPVSVKLLFVAWPKILRKSLSISCR